MRGVYSWYRKVGTTREVVRMSKHTPGPWTDSPILERESGRSVSAVFEHDDGGCTDTPVCAMCPTATDDNGDYLYPMTEEQEANARLIAAAPEMLEILQALVRTVIYRNDAAVALLARIERA